MFANFVIRTGASARFPAIPADGVVREADGTMTVWVTEDAHHFRRRSVKTGITRDGYWQILSGIKPGERVAIDGALFLSNATTAS